MRVNNATCIILEHNKSDIFHNIKISSYGQTFTYLYKKMTF